jgi:hypothetical protein
MVKSSYKEKVFLVRSVFMVSRGGSLGQVPQTTPPILTKSWERFAPLTPKAGALLASTRGFDEGALEGKQLSGQHQQISKLSK